jgi:iron complex transport system ATP-binding protein
MNLAIENLSFSYNHNSKLLSSISLAVERGDALCLLGPNGTGKTTLLRCILGINSISSGSVRIGGNDLKKMRPRDLAKAVAYVPQAASAAFSYRVFDMVMMGRAPHLHILSAPGDTDKNIVHNSLARLNIAHLADKPFTAISGGERQLVLIARALAQQSKIFIMDEPTANLDYGNQIRILRVVNEIAGQGYAIIMTSHFPNHAFLSCNKVAILKGGKILGRGSPDEIITEDNLNKLYSVKIKIASVDFPEEKMNSVKVCVPLLA